MGNKSIELKEVKDFYWTIPHKGDIWRLSHPTHGVVWEKPGLESWWGLKLTSIKAGSTMNMTFGDGSDTFEYSLDGVHWKELNANITVTLNTWEAVALRVKGVSTRPTPYIHLTGKFEASGSIMSLVNGSKPTFKISVDDQFSQLFWNGSTGLPDDVLATPPELPATTLSNGCYSQMFLHCTALRQAPVLPAMRMMDSCYSSMFSGCSSLLEPPELPSTQLAANCYDAMFNRCTSLINGPVLPASFVETESYRAMFYGCSSLKSLEVHATSLSASDCLIWLNSTASGGTLRKLSSATIPNVPSSWTVVNI